MAVTYARRLGLFSATMSVIGGIIGSGIFLNPSIVAQRVGTSASTLAVWIGGGVVALIGAFIFGELGQRRPRVGGGYSYIREAFGPLPAFLYAWTLLLMIAPGATAAVAVAFGNYSTALLGVSPALARPLGVGRHPAPHPAQLPRRHLRRHHPEHLHPPQAGRHRHGGRGRASAPSAIRSRPAWTAPRSRSSPEPAP